MHSCRNTLVLPLALCYVTGVFVGAVSTLQSDGIIDYETNQE